MALIYQATNRLNGKRYIGVTRKKLARRQNGHKQKAAAGAISRFHAAIRKYGWNAFEWSVLAEYETWQEAVVAEVEFIAERKPEYNVLPGGEGGWTLSEKQKAIMIAAHLGRKASPETRAKMSAAHKGLKTGTPKSVAATIERNKKRVWTPEMRAKVAASLQKYVFTPGHKAKVSIGQLGRAPTNARPVICLTDSLEYESAREAERVYGLKPRAVAQLCTRTPRTSTLGEFRYIDGPDADQIRKRVRDEIAARLDMALMCFCGYLRK